MSKSDSYLIRIFDFYHICSIMKTNYFIWKHLYLLHLSFMQKGRKKNSVQKNIKLQFLKIKQFNHAFK